MGSKRSQISIYRGILTLLVFTDVCCAVVVDVEKEVVVDEQSDAILKCNYTTNSNNLTMHWYKDNPSDRLTIAENVGNGFTIFPEWNRHTVLQDASNGTIDLKIRNTEKNDSGIYICLVTGFNETDGVGNITLSVNPVNSLEERNRIIIICVFIFVFGVPSGEIFTAFMYSIMEPVDLTSRDRVIVIGVAFVPIASIPIIVNFLRKKKVFTPSNVKVQDILITSALIKWTYKGPIEGVFFQVVVNRNEREVVKTEWQSKTEVTLDQLKSRTQYVARVQAKKKKRTSRLSKPAVFTTKE